MSGQPLSTYTVGDHQAEFLSAWSQQWLKQFRGDHGVAIREAIDQFAQFVVESGPSSDQRILVLAWLATTPSDGFVDVAGRYREALLEDPAWTLDQTDARMKLVGRVRSAAVEQLQPVLAVEATKAT